jgi:hypothetical protein
MTTPTCPAPTWKVTGLLAIAKYLVGEISEGLLSKKLGLDRLETRRCVQQFLDTALDNAGVPIERITTLEQRCATLAGQVARIQLDREDLQRRVAARDGENHTLRNHLQAAQLITDELRQQLKSDRAYLAEIARELNLESFEGPGGKGDEPMP